MKIFFFNEFFSATFVGIMWFLLSLILRESGFEFSDHIGVCLILYVLKTLIVMSCTYIVRIVQ